jgi:hypothetical protein
MFGTKSAMPADERFVIIFIPENRIHDAGLDACAAAGTALGLQEHAAALAKHERIFRAGAGAWGIYAGPADRQHETVLHTSGRLYTYAGFCKTDIIVNTRACEHAALTAYAFVRVQNIKSHKPLLTIIKPVNIYSGLQLPRFNKLKAYRFKYTNKCPG